MRRSARSARLAGSVLAATLLLAGCIGMPTSGGVHAGVDEAPAGEGLDLFAEDPQPDALPTAIVSGFLGASAAGLADSFEVANKYLTGEGASGWAYGDGVTVYSDARPPLLVDGTDHQVEVTVTVVGTVDQQGAYTEARPGTTATFEFGLVQVLGDQWRISTLEDGVLMSEVNFGAQYRQMSLYFLTPDRQRLVPDVRWFPQARSAPAAVRALLAGPAGWLAPGVASAFPTGTALSVDAVPVAGNEAQISLTDEVLAADPDDRRLLVAQLEETLRQLPQIRRVQISVDGGGEMTVAREPGTVSGPPAVDRTPSVLAADGLARFNGDDVVPTDLTVPLATPVTDVAVGYSGQPAVGLVEGTRLVTLPTPDGAGSSLVDRSTALVGPSYDVDGWVWTGEAGNDGRLLTVDPRSGEELAVEAPELAGATLLGIRVSREGARLAYAVERDGVASVYVAAIERDLDQRPVRIASGHAIGASVAEVFDLVWVDGERVALLGSRQGSDTTTVVLVTLGGRTVSLPAVTGAAEIASGDGDRELYVATTSGDLYGRSGNGWRVVATDVRDPVFAG